MMKLLATGLFAALTLPVAAETISEFTDTLGAASATEAGRPARYYEPQDWAGDEVYPGLAPGSASNSYQYKTYTLSSSLFATALYLEITNFDASGNGDLYLAAYGNSYDPAHRDANWLGDQGTSSAYIYGEADQFEVLMPPGEDLVLVLTQMDANNSLGGANDLYSIGVYAFTDTDYDEPPAAASPVPEPTSWMLLATGLCVIPVMLRGRFGHTTTSR